MDDQQTCGQGLAEHSALPAQLAEVTEAMADNLQVHMAALELDDEPARQEHAVYLRLVEEQRQAAGRERHPFKTDVRKLKELGLTESLEVGYRLSPRGRALLDREPEQYR